MRLARGRYEDERGPKLDLRGRDAANGIDRPIRVTAVAHHRSLEVDVRVVSYPTGGVAGAYTRGNDIKGTSQFVVDTSRFSAKALAKMGLDAGDTAASDHLPVVVDLKPR